MLLNQAQVPKANFASKTLNLEIKVGKVIFLKLSCKVDLFLT